MNNSVQIAPIPFLQVEGEAQARGLAIGQQTRQRIEHSLNTYQQLFASCDISWPAAVEKARQYLDITEKLSGIVTDELHGMARGAGVDVESLFALNCRTEILPADFLSRVMADASIDGKDSNIAVERRSQRTIGELANECTAFASVNQPDRVWLAQNWDWCGLQRQAMCVIDAAPAQGPRFITVTEAGMLAKIGINDRGLGITLNILRSERDGSNVGVPVHVLLRVLLDCESVAEALDLVGGLTFGSSSNVMLVDSSGHVASVELSPLGCRVLPAEQNRLCHTNHFLHKDLLPHDVGRPGNHSTLSRLARAESAVSDCMSFDDINSLLSDQSDGNESVCRFADASLPAIAQIETVCAVIMNVSHGTLAVSDAQPSLSPFRHYALH
ncbi:MAG: C45 family autoproteolytic acyltransferase/hydrolase [Granulosicoccus sp.]